MLHEAQSRSVCSLRCVLHRSKKKTKHAELLEPEACQLHGQNIMPFKAPRGEIQYICNHGHFDETQLRLSGSMRAAVCVTCISWNTSKQAKKTQRRWNCFRRCPAMPYSVQHDKSLYDIRTVETCTVKCEICIENLVVRTSNGHYFKLKFEFRHRVQFRHATRHISNRRS